MNLSTSVSAEVLKSIERRRKEAPLSTIEKYNLAALNYRGKRYQESRELLGEILHQSTSDKQLIKKVFYNLGNSLFRIAERERDLAQALHYYRESMGFFRTVIEMDKASRRFSMSSQHGDRDAQHNYLVVRKRVKVLTDKLKERQRDEERSKSVYQIARELLVSEQRIKEQLAAMKSTPKGGLDRETRIELLAQRKKNLEKLSALRNRLHNSSPNRTGVPSVSGGNVNHI